MLRIMGTGVAIRHVQVMIRRLVALPDWAVVTLTVRTGSPAVENMSIAEAEYTNFPSLLQYCTIKYVTTLEKTRKIT